MPLVRVEVRNEYALGAPELYRDVNKEDPKEILDGVAVAGLVGVLRQLGDLAEFAAEVFHGLQEEVTITSSRSRKLMARVQRIEAAVSPLEKAVLAQRSHLHFAYTAGSNWHTRIRCEENHFVYSDVPQFIMDSYEDCRGPPRLHLLDRFEPGGAGSCLKRYSDPTFFKRASLASGEASTVKILHKKGRKIKKRRSWPRNSGVSKDASFSYHSGRMQFTELNVGGHTSPSQTMSTYDATQRSDLGEQSNSDMRNGSDYIEGEFRPSYSVQAEEQESREYISSPVKRRDSDFLDYTFLEEKTSDAYDDDIQINLSQEQAGCSSSSVTWDEKPESVERTTQYDHDDMTEEEDHAKHVGSVSPDLNLETTIDNAVNFATVEKMDIRPSSDQAVPTLEYGDVHHEDIDSETDNFMDALNTIESESETDIDCMKKKEVEHYSKLEDKGVDDGDGEPDPVIHNLECESSDSESNVLVNSSPINGNGERNLILVYPETPSLCNSSIKEVAAEDESSSVSLVDKALQSTQRALESSNGNIDDDTKVGSVSSAVSSNFRDDKSGMPIIDGTRSIPESQKNAPETSNVTSFTFWTNGGLLGLQPSKPPDFGVLNAPPQDSPSKKDGKICSSAVITDKDPGKPDQINNSKNIEEGLDTNSLGNNGASFRKTSWKISPDDLDIKHGKFGDSLNPNIASSTEYSEYQASGKPQENSRSSSRMFELGNRLFTNGSDGFEQKNGQNVTHRTFSGRTKGLFGGESSILSPSSSPPLEHMKISFQPIAGFETSKLKLKFPDGNTNNNENSRDIFPSFQLVPEAPIARHNVGMDSDDDTFYRSSPSLSNGCHSPGSESNSEQWESGESPTNKDRDLYDALRRISLTESVSTVANNGVQFPSVENNSRQNSQFDLENLETQNHSFREEVRDYTDSNDLVGPMFSTSPAPPPLPPVQWRGMANPHLDDTKDKCGAISEDSNYAFGVKLSASTISQQPKPAPFNHVEILETKSMLKSKQLSSHKSSNGRMEANQDKSINGKDDFLQQIRTKSFNLRPTVTKKPNALSGASANFQVTAILEKANAIRQAVGSDDGDDDSYWSEA